MSAVSLAPLLATGRRPHPPAQPGSGINSSSKHAPHISSHSKDPASSHRDSSDTTSAVTSPPLPKLGAIIGAPSHPAAAAASSSSSVSAAAVPVLKPLTNESLFPRLGRAKSSSDGTSAPPQVQPTRKHRASTEADQHPPPRIGAAVSLLPAVSPRPGGNVASAPGDTSAESAQAQTARTERMAVRAQKERERSARRKRKKQEKADAAAAATAAGASSSAAPNLSAVQVVSDVIVSPLSPITASEIVSPATAEAEPSDDEDQYCDEEYAELSAAYSRGSSAAYHAPPVSANATSAAAVTSEAPLPAASSSSATSPAAPSAAPIATAISPSAAALTPSPPPPSAARSTVPPAVLTARHQRHAVSDAPAEEVGEELEGAAAPVKPLQLPPEPAAIVVASSPSPSSRSTAARTQQGSAKPTVAASPKGASTTRRAPAPSPSPRANARVQGSPRAGKTTANATQATAATARGPARKPSATSSKPVPATARAGLSSASKQPAASPRAKAAANKLNTQGEDEYADDDWRGLTVKKQAASSASRVRKGASADLPSELLRFTLLPQALRSLYEGTTTVPKGHTTLEFCRSQRVAASSEAAISVPSSSSGSALAVADSVMRWMPVYSSVLASPRGAAGGSTVTVDAQLLGAGAEDAADEPVVVQLWQEDEQTGGEEKTASLPPSECKSPEPKASSSWSRTLLAEFTSSLADFRAQSLERPLPSAASHAAPPRSALKPSRPLGCTSDGGSNPAPPKLHVRFFDKVEIFTITSRLERTKQLPASSVVSAEIEEKNNADSPSEQSVNAIDFDSLILADTTAAAPTPKRAPVSVAAAGGKQSAVAANGKKQSLASNKPNAVAPPAAQHTPSPPPAAAASSSSSHLRVSVRGRDLCVKNGASTRLEFMLLHGGVWRSLYSGDLSSAAAPSAELTWKILLANVHADTSAAATEALDAPLLLRCTDESNDVVGQCLTTLRQLIPEPAAMAGALALAPQAFPLVPAPPARTSASPSSAMTSSPPPAQRLRDCGSLLFSFMPPRTPASGSRRGSAAKVAAARPTSKA